MESIDKFPVKELPNRYCIGRTALYTRFDAARIKPKKEGLRSYVSGEELEELDRLDSHIKSGGSLDGFKAALDGKLIIESPQWSDGFNETLVLVEAITKHFAAPPIQPDPLAKLKALEYAASHGFLLTTAQVRELSGATPKGSEFVRGVFRFERRGKIGVQAAWMVTQDLLIDG